MSFTALLIHRSDIQTKADSLDSYEVVPVWTTVASSVPCRHNTSNQKNYTDGLQRENNDDDIFFYDPTVVIKRGDRIIYGGNNYDVIKVDKLFDSTKAHHLEVRAQLTDNK